jgi:hypothetical protein
MRAWCWQLMSVGEGAFYRIYRPFGCISEYDVLCDDTHQMAVAQLQIKRPARVTKVCCIVA